MLWSTFNLNDTILILQYYIKFGYNNFHKFKFKLRYMDSVVIFEKVNTFSIF